MKHIFLGAAASLLAVNMALAQTAASSPSAAPGTSTPGTSMGAPPTATPTNTVHDDKAAASGNDNQAVVTTGANADEPAHGANSFTKRQAMGRMGKKGYHHVTGLTKDQNGVWRGTSTKDGQPVQVWLDYKGNVGQTTS